MDQLPRGNEGFAHSSQYGDSQQQYPYDNLFQTGADQNSYDASWGINASTFPAQSRAHTQAPSWPQNANHLSPTTPQANINGSYSRSLSHSPAGYGQNAFNGYGAAQNFQYRQQPQYDPALVAPHVFNQNFNYNTTNYQVPNPQTVAPNALQHEARPQAYGRAPYDGPDSPANAFGTLRPSNSFPQESVNQAALMSKIPKGKIAGRFSIINFDDLAKSTTSERMGNFLNIGTEALNYDSNRAALPNYAPRKSRSELRRIAGSDPKLLARLGKKTLKKPKLPVVATRPLQTSATPSVGPSEKIKYEDDSPSEDESSSASDDESSYTSDDDNETSPLPPKRPEAPKGATEYDTIKALWRGKRKSVASDSIRKGIVDFWEIVKTIRDRWKADQAAFQEAETKDRKNELPLLESRVKDQRDMMEAAFKAALKHGHRNIVELLAENQSLLFLCYQFLLDRFKAEDFNSALPRAILETMTLFTTITDDKLEKTHLVKVLPKYIKKGDAKTQFYAKRITSNAAAASKDKKTATPDKKAVPKETNSASPTIKRPEPETKTGVKRALANADDGGIQKKIVTGVAKSGAIGTKQTRVARKPATLSESAKAGPATTVVKAKQVVAKPSGLFSSLQSAAKKPGTSNASKAAQQGTTAKPTDKPANASNANAAPKSTFSFAETMANLSKPKEEKVVIKQETQAPQETAEEKKKRLRREARRHLHVSFKDPAELAEYFTIVPYPGEVEQDHDASELRDFADVGGEGRMFKQQHQMMDVDEEEETAEIQETLIDFTEPTLIDFSVVDPDERSRNYAQFAGGELEVESEERAKRDEYEANNLIVFYTDPRDIPPNPREPADPTNGDPVESVTKFGIPDGKHWAARVEAKKSGPYQMNKRPQQLPSSVPPTTSFDLSKFTNLMPSQPFTSPPTSFPPTATAPASDALSSILANLKASQTPNQGTPPMGGYVAPFSAPPPMMSTYPTPQPPAMQGQPDLAAILAQIQQSQPTAQQAPPMAGFNFGAPNAVPNMIGYQPPPQAQQAPPAFENPDRKQWREGTGENNMTRTTRNSAASNPYFRTKVCKYWQEGRCQKGEACSYKHEED